MRRHAGRRVFDIELEAHAALQRLRQAGDHAADFDVAAFDGDREFVRQTQMGEARRPNKAQRRRPECQQRPRDQAA